MGHHPHLRRNHLDHQPTNTSAKTMTERSAGWVCPVCGNRIGGVNVSYQGGYPRCYNPHHITCRTKGTVMQEIPWGARVVVVPKG